MSYDGSNKKSSVRQFLYKIGFLKKEKLFSTNYPMHNHRSVAALAPAPVS
jgi:hypothetical protein